MLEKIKKAAKYLAMESLNIWAEYLLINLTLWIVSPIMRMCVPSSVQTSAANNLNPNTAPIFVSSILGSASMLAASHKKSQLNAKAAKQTLSDSEAKELTTLQDSPRGMMAFAVGTTVAVAYSYDQSRKNEVSADDVLLIGCVASEVGRVAYDAYKLASKKWSEYYGDHSQSEKPQPGQTPVPS